MNDRLSNLFQSADDVPRTVRTARVANGIAFVILGAIFATWAVRIPAIETLLRLSKADIGIALLGLAVGSVLGLIASGVLVARYGAKAVVRLAIVTYCLLLPVIPLSGGLYSLLAVLAGFGFGKGLLDVAANTQALHIERVYSRQIMGGFHALYSAGALLGSLVGALFTGLGLSARAHFLVLAATFLAIGLAASVWLLPPDEADADETDTEFALPSREILGFCLIGFCALLVEGIANDWSAVFLEGAAGARPAVAALGFAAFALAMTLGRFAADRAVDAIGPRRFIRLTVAISALGVIVTLVPIPPVALLGFGILGFGIGGVAPVNLSLVGRADLERSSESAVAAVSTSSYAGFAVGPVAIGLLADATSLRIAFLPAIGVAAVIATLTFTLPGRGGSSPAVRSD
ncbi:MFS transporter [Haloterrigena sp. SYSU A121-1]|uniref:MFS transporter n=1 Tax=Haloterrigena gelatinilytica TaxID=2741724 RepID=A0A8J8GKF0_9EURY|nr:MFS transporter [Haloterrigena gelatinilytica]NUB91643.1 MFS transporter [Haloterrigena gelatinilytica]